jgi:selenocysteine lyase/cysteine desulfurase
MTQRTILKCSRFIARLPGGAVLTIRRGILRVALHLYNNEDDVQQLLDIVASWRSRVAGLTRICRANVRQ